jgi:hypothetical protein
MKVGITTVINRSDLERPHMVVESRLVWVCPGCGADQEDFILEDFSRLDTLQDSQVIMQRRLNLPHNLRDWLCGDCQGEQNGK